MQLATETLAASSGTLRGCELRASGGALRATGPVAVIAVLSRAAGGTSPTASKPYRASRAMNSASSVSPAQGDRSGTTSVLTQTGSTRGGQRPTNDGMTFPATGTVIKRKCDRDEHREREAGTPGQCAKRAVQGVHASSIGLRRVGRLKRCCHEQTRPVYFGRLFATATSRCSFAGRVVARADSRQSDPWTHGPMDPWDPWTHLVCKLSDARPGDGPVCGGWHAADDRFGVGTGHGDGPWRLHAPEGGDGAERASGRAGNEREARNDSAVIIRGRPPPLVNASERFQITKSTVIEVSPGQPDLQRIGKWIADLVAPALEASLTIREGTGAPASGVIRLEVASGSPQGDEGYQLTVSPTGIRIVSSTPAGVFYGVQTLRQLLPWSSITAGHVPSTSSCRPRKSATSRASGGGGVSRRLAALLQRRRGEALHRSGRDVQVQPPAPAPLRRSGMADPDRRGRT